MVAPTDAQTIAFLLQKQLEDIDNEIRLIKEEKQNTEQRAEELENRVHNLDLSATITNNSDCGVSPTLTRSGLEMKPQQNYIVVDRQSPINSGRSTPSHTKSDILKMALNKPIQFGDDYKSMTVNSINSKKLIILKLFFMKLS